MKITKSKLKREDYPECSVKKCETQAHHYSKENYYCKEHYMRHIRGNDPANRTRFDANKITFEEDHCIMEIYNSENEVSGHCYFDKEDYDLVKDYRWGFTRQRYVYMRIGKSHITMHRFILGLQDCSTPLVDHENLAKSDNRRFNLRIADKSKNEMNKGLLSSNTSGVKGVYYVNREKMWCSNIEIDGKRKTNRHSCFDEAVKNRVIKESKYFKDYSYLYNKESKTLKLTYMSHDDNVQTFIEVDISGNILNFNKLE